MDTGTGTRSPDVKADFNEHENATFPSSTLSQYQRLDGHPVRPFTFYPTLSTQLHPDYIVTKSWHARWRSCEITRQVTCFDSCLLLPLKLWIFLSHKSALTHCTSLILSIIYELLCLTWCSWSSEQHFSNTQTWCCNYAPSLVTWCKRREFLKSEMKLINNKCCPEVL